MSDESYSFSTARARLEDIVAQVRKKDTSLEKSLDLLEEGVKLANACTELIDHQDWVSANAPEGGAAEAREAVEGEVSALDSVDSGERLGADTDAPAASDDAWADESESVPGDAQGEPYVDEE
jgi:exodeoxyribonuclease VII small subunit